MTAQVRFVNTGSTAGGDGTTNATTGAQRAYPTLAAWNTAEVADLVAAGDTHTVNVDGGADTTVVTMSAWTTTTVNWLKVVPHANSAHAGKLDTGKYYLSTAGNYDVALQDSGGGTIIDGLQFNPSAGNLPTGVKTIAGGSSTKEARVINCIFKGFSQNGSAIRRTTNGPTVVINNLIYDWGKGIEIDSVGSSSTNNPCAIYNNTIEGCADNGIHLDLTGQQVYAKNNLLSNDTVDWLQDATPNSTHATNLSSDATSPDSAFRSKTVTFTNLAGEDYSTADADVVGLGTDLSGDSIFAFSTDINGAARGASWDIGAFQEPSSGSAPSRNPGMSGGMLHLDGGMQG